MSEKEIQVSVQKALKILYATISLIVLIIAVWIIVDCFKKTPDQQKMVMNYTVTPSVDYKVFLKPNNFYDRNYLDKGKKYIANIIDYVDFNFNYKYNTTRQVNTVYTYSIDATISSEYESSGAVAELWSKRYNLLPQKTLTKNDNTGFNISENLKLDYNKYDKLAAKFREEYGIAADTKLTLIFNINTTSTLEGYEKPITDSKTVKVDMPLNKVVTDISTDKIETVNDTITETIPGERHINYVLLIGAVIAVVITAPASAISFYKLFKITNVSQYIVQQKKILKSYGDVIAEVTTKPDLYGLKIIEVKDFENLINIEDELRVPILFYELVEQSESWFVITTSTQAYRYILKSQVDLQGIYKPVHKKSKKEQ